MRSSRNHGWCNRMGVEAEPKHNRKLGVMSPFRAPRRLLRTVAAALAVLFAFVAWSFVDRPTCEVEYTLSADATRLITGFTPMHAYLAEYERSLAVVRADGTRSEIKLFPDTGGYGRGQLYRAEDGALYLKAYFDVARVDPKTREVSVVSSVVPAGAQYLGAFDYIRNVGWKFLVPAESPELPLEATGG